MDQKYQVVSGRVLGEVEAEVSRLIGEGWEPAGGIATVAKSEYDISDSDSGLPQPPRTVIWYHQAVFRRGYGPH